MPAGTALEALFLMFFGRLGSLNALEQTRSSAFWSRRLGRSLPSADTLGRVAAGVDPDRVREVLDAFYAARKAAKAIPAPPHGLMALVVDGHESTSSELRCCDGCLERVVTTSKGPRTQYYHRYVAGLLVGDGVELWLDLEPQRRGEDEVAAAIRLTERIHGAHPRAFDVVVGDGLYTQARFFEAIRALGKDVIAVLKREELRLTREARELLNQLDAVAVARPKGRTCQAWDVEDLRLGEDDAIPVRVVRTIETTSVRRQRTGRVETMTTEWLWVTTIERARASTATIISIGHRRWAVENEGFNVLANHWKADHIYRNDPVAIEMLTLLAMLAANVAQAFLEGSLKPEFRARTTLSHVIALIAGAIRSGQEECAAPP